MTPIGDVYVLRSWPGERIGFNGKLATQACPTCHIMHGYPEELDRRAQLYNKGDYPSNHLTIYCPNGHGWSYLGDHSALSRERAARRRAEEALSYTQDLLNAEKRGHAATKGQLTKVTQRVRAGVCPECNRTFKQLARHVRAKHAGPEAARALAVEMARAEGA